MYHTAPVYVYQNDSFLWWYLLLHHDQPRYSMETSAGAQQMEEASAFTTAWLWWVCGIAAAIFLVWLGFYYGTQW